MPTYHLTLLGRPSLTGPTGPIPIPVRKAQALLFYLATTGKPVSRSHLAGLLWEDSPEADALRNLRLTLHRLRAAFPAEALRVAHDSLAWDAAAGVQLDTATLLDLLERGDAAALAAAVSLRQGPFLHGFELPDSPGFSLWLAAERQCWDERTLAALQRLIHLAEEARTWQQAAGYARQALAIDSLAEHFHRRLMLAHYQSGQRAAALAAFAACAAILRAEIGVAPDPATSALADDIRAERIPLAPGRVQVAPVLPAPDFRHPAPAVLPLVGRQAELATAHAAIHDSHLGERRVLLISGEAGSGKSRLVAELMAGGAPGMFLVAQCYEGMSAQPFAPITLALRQALPKADVEQLPAVWLREVARLLPELAEERPELQETARRMPEPDRERLLEGVARFLKTLPSPLTLCFENLHVADEATLQLLGYLARREGPLRRGPARALVATCHPGSGARHLLAELEREDRLRRIDLTPLSAGAVTDLVRAGTGTEDSALSAGLFAESGGHAFYAVELLRAWQSARGDGGGDPGGGQSAADVAHLPLPRSIQAVIRRRLERLAGPARELVTAAALFARPADFDLLAQLTAMAPAEATLALEAACGAGILTEMHEGSPAATVGLSHELIRRVVRAELSAPRLRSLHQQAFHESLRYSGAEPQRVGQRGGPTLQLAEELAAHALAGGLWEPAAAWFQAAADAADRVFAYAESARLLEQALLCLERLPPTPARSQAAIDLRLRLGNLSYLGLPRRAEPWLAPALDDARALGDEERQAAAMLAEGQLLIARGRLPEAAALLESLLPAARRLPEPTLLAQALSLLGTARIFLAEYEAARACLAEAVPLFGFGATDVLYRQARSSLVWVLAIRGEFEAAVAEGIWFLVECRQVGNPAGIAQAATAVANACLARGRWEEALGFAREGVQAAQRSDQRFYGYVNAMDVGMALVRLAQVDEGVRALEEIVALAEAEGIGALLDAVLLFLSQGYLAAGRLAEAEAAALRGRALAAAGGARYMGYCLDRGLGEVYAAVGREGEARALIRGALAGLHGLGARAEEARCHACLASLAEGEAERREHGLQAAAMFRAMGMEPPGP